MKNFLIIFITLCFSITTTSAFSSSKIKEAKLKEFLGDNVFLIEMGLVCKHEYRFEILDVFLSEARRIGGYSETSTLDETKLDLLYKMAVLEIPDRYYLKLQNAKSNKFTAQNSSDCTKLVPILNKLYKGLKKLGH